MSFVLPDDVPVEHTELLQMQAMLTHTTKPVVYVTTNLSRTQAAVAMAEALGADAARIKALFVSVDPERDTVDVLAKYIPAFGGAITGLTGEPGNVKQAARAFRAHYEKVDSPGNPGGYTVEHQSSLYLIRPDGSFETAFPHGMSVARMVDALRRHITTAP